MPCDIIERRVYNNIELRLSHQSEDYCRNNGTDIKINIQSQINLISLYILHIHIIN